LEPWKLGLADRIQTEAGKETGDHTSITAAKIDLELCGVVETRGEDRDVYERKSARGVGGIAGKVLGNHISFGLGGVGIVIVLNIKKYIQYISGPGKISVNSANRNSRISPDGSGDGTRTAYRHR